MTSVEDWTLEFAEEVDLPGWVFLPELATPEDQDAWITEISDALWEIIGTPVPEDVPTSKTDVREALSAGLAARTESTSFAMYQVWPVAAAATVLCHLNLAAREDLPDWSDSDGVTHAADARYLGPGVQYSTRRPVEGMEGVEVNSVHFVFADDDVALILSLEEAPAPLISRALVGFTLLKDALRLTRGDGAPFRACPPSGLREDSLWPLDEVGQTR